MSAWKTLAGLTAAAMALGACTDGGNQRQPLEREEPRAVPASYRTAISSYEPEETLDRLLQAMDRRDLTIFAVIDHQAGASQAELEMPFATVVVFGAPRMGTPLMQTVPQLAAELPLRAAVYVDGDETYVAVTSVKTLRRSYPALDGEAERLSTIGENLSHLLAEATGSD
jgi:uncharacterized protein (DUF302 family)